MFCLLSLSLSLFPDKQVCFHYLLFYVMIYNDIYIYFVSRIFTSAWWKEKDFLSMIKYILYSWTNLCIQELGPFVCILGVNQKKEITFEAVEHNSGCRTMYIWSPWLSSLYISWFLCQVHKAYVEFTTCIKKWKGN